MQNLACSSQNHGKGKASLDKFVLTQFFIDMWITNEAIFMQNVFQAIPTIIPPAEWTD